MKRLYSEKEKKRGRKAGRGREGGGREGKREPSKIWSDPGNTTVREKTDRSVMLKKLIST